MTYNFYTMDAYNLGRQLALRDCGLTKIALRLKGLHGTSGAWKKIIPGFKGTIFKKDPNPAAVYAATASRRTLPGVTDYARRATAARGGAPTVGKVLVDTSKGWQPHGFTQRGREAYAKTFGLKGLPGREDMLEHVTSLIGEGDWLRKQITIAMGPQRAGFKRRLGEIYKELHNTVGAWRAPGAVKPIKWKEV